MDLSFDSNFSTAGEKDQPSCIAKSWRTRRSTAMSSNSIPAMMGGLGVVRREKGRGGGGEKRKVVGS
jgi:hypothetical protein